MNKTITLITIMLLSVCATAQNLKFKKDIQPLIYAKDYTESAKNTCVQFHNQNTNSDGTLTEKAVLLQYDNVFATREHLGYCFYALGVQQVNSKLLDSAIYYVQLAQTMTGTPDVSTLVKRFKEKREQVKVQEGNKLVQEEKQKQEEQKKLKQEEYDKLHAEKTSTVTFIGGEFIGYCDVLFRSDSGEDLHFINPDLGRFSNQDGMLCHLKDMYQSESFVITYKLGKVEVYSSETETKTKELVDANVIIDIQLANATRDSELSVKELSECQIELNRQVEELSKFRNQNPDFIDKLLERAKSIETVDRCNQLNAEIVREIQVQKELRVSIQETGKLQAQYKSKDACPTCMVSTAKKFLQACIDVNGSAIQSNLCACAVSGDKTSCEKIGRIRPFPYARYMAKPDVNVARGLLEKQDRFVVYYFSESIAGVVIKPSATNQARVIYMVKESDKWKVIGIDESNDRAMISYVMSK